ncbi:hypothetical protein EON81_07755 [bacterium]|nr:MAG: hypothetical protein EON81_07755 [bacterium]
MNTPRAIALAGLVGCAVAAPAQRLEPNSFVRKPVNSRAELLNHFDNDPVVRARYAKHFGASQAAVRDMFSELTTRDLKQSGRYVVYNYQPDGAIQSRRLFYTRNEKVLVDGAGRPVLRLACGNPMVAGFYLAKPPTIGSQTPVDPPLFAEDVPLTIIETVEPPAYMEEELVYFEPTPVAAQPLVPQPQFVPAGGGVNLFPLLGIAAIGLIANPPGNNPGTEVFPAVPEPTGIVAAGIGIAVLLRRRRQNRL